MLDVVSPGIESYLTYYSRIAGKRRRGVRWRVSFLSRWSILRLQLLRIRSLFEREGYALSRVPKTLSAVPGELISFDFLSEEEKCSADVHSV